MDWILQPWPWYIGGVIIATTLILLTLMGKSFGFSSNLRTMCTIMGAGQTCDFFKFNWKSQSWNLLFLVGTILGGFIAYHFLSVDQGSIPLASDTIEKLQALGFENPGSSYLPAELFSQQAWTSIKSITILFIAGILVGFGSRYAGGCTSGHAITGLSNLQLPSLMAVIGFFIGGLIMIHLLFPLIF
ncbi:YeeE/YedE family protein [Myroides sp. LJL119]